MTASATGGTPDKGLKGNGKRACLEDFASSIVETVREPLLILNDRLEVEAANAPYFQTFQVHSEETLGRSLVELGEGQWNIPCLRNGLEQAFAGGKRFEDFEVQRTFPHIGSKVLRLSARLVTSPFHLKQRILLIIDDVTEFRKAQAELQRLNNELERRVQDRTSRLETTNRELEAFCYSVSHDLRAPLRAIDGFSEEVLRRYGDRLDSQGKHYLDRVRLGTQRMGELIDALLDLSRLNRGEIKREQVDLSTLAGTIVKELQQREPARQVTIQIEPGLSVVGDASMLRVAMENLLSNAWKFTGAKQGATIQFGFGEHKNGPAFFVRDDGAGFDMAYVGKLFGAFQRLHPQREFPGHGIGLATVQRVVHRHGGKVWAEGEPRKGATFWFSLPRELEA
jgi:signal transduction histidine kinase